MSFIDAVRAVAFNKHATKAAELSAEALVTVPKSTTENPYLTARGRGASGDTCRDQ